MKLFTNLAGFFATLSILSAAESWETGKNFRWHALQPAEQSRPGFTAIPGSQTGVAFTNVLSPYAIAANRVLANGSGVAAGDVDGDGLPDLLLCGMQSRSVLYKNLGQWHFQDVTVESGLPQNLFWGRGAVFADINGDGALDLLYVTAAEGLLCFVNDGRGKFTDFSMESGLRTNSIGSTTLTLADVDGNGTLDLYVTNYRQNDIRDRGQLQLPAAKGKPFIPPQWKDHFLMRNGQIAEYGQADQLFLNDGKGHFKPVSWTEGAFLDENGKPLTEPPLDWGLTATFRDVNGDGAPDLYVCNDYWTPDRFWINDGKGHFRALSSFALRKTSNSSMGVDFADLDRDGRLDFFVVDMLARDLSTRKTQMVAEKASISPIGLVEDRPQYMVNMLYRQREDLTFAEVGQFAGVAASDWSWSPTFLDVDLDGYDDLLITAGHFRNVQDIDAEREIQTRQHSWKGFTNDIERQKAFTLEMVEHHKLYPMLNCPIRAYRNAGGWRFQEQTESWGFQQVGVHHGLATADLDGDGDLDLIVNTLNGQALLYRNEASGARLAVRLKGKAPGLNAVGAKVTLLGGAVPNQTAEVIAGGRYLAGSEMELVFAAGTHREGMQLEVLWRDGKRTRVQDVQAGRLYEITEDNAATEPARPPEASQRPLFADVSARIVHQHHEPDFDDFERQPLLPFKLSQPGPGVSWFDLDADGREDLIVGAGFGGALAVFHGEEHGNFTRWTNAPNSGLPNDLGTILGLRTDKAMLLGSVTGYETPATNSLVRFDLSQKTVSTPLSVPIDMSAAGALAFGGIDAAGRPLLFVGGHVLPGQYPVGAPSRLYSWSGSDWKLVQNFDNLGIVNGAVWSDLRDQGTPDLLLACEWGPIRVFRSADGKYSEITDALGLRNYTGLWKGVTTADVNGDGKMDIIASNWGLNSSYQAASNKPLVFFYGELGQPGAAPIIETAYDSAGRLAPTRPLMAMAPSLPFLFEKYSTQRAYSLATVDEILGDLRPKAKQVSAATLESAVFLNAGDKFSIAPLPFEAQIAPAFGITAADFDGDGHEDLFLAQNFFPTQPDFPRLDAGRGVLLKGDGKGGFAAMDGSASGIKIYGEQRGAAVCDFDEDGRPDLVVGQNGAETKLYRNSTGKPGLRVRIQGPASNPSAIGTRLRVKFRNGQYGPVREIHAGSGYWSQDSAVQVLALPFPAETVEVLLPGGRVKEIPVRDQAELLIKAADL